MKNARWQYKHLIEFGTVGMKKYDKEVTAVQICKFSEFFFYRTSCCVTELRGNNKIICFNQTQQYFIIYFNLLSTSFSH